MPGKGYHPLPVGVRVGSREGMPVVSGSDSVYFAEGVVVDAFSD